MATNETIRELAKQVWLDAEIGNVYMGAADCASDSKGRKIQALDGRGGIVGEAGAETLDVLEAKLRGMAPGATDTNKSS
jgi:hypothetical protein